MKRKIFISIAVAVVILATFFPLHIEPATPGNAVLRIGQGTYRITIGNIVNAQEADYTCDGSADDETFQEALDDLPSIGGQLFVLAGTYNWTANATVTRAIDNVSIIGVGASVYFDGDGTTALFTAGGDKWVFSNLQTDAGGLEMGGTSDWMWLNIFIGGTFYSVEAPDDPLGGTVEELDDIGDVNVPTPTDQYLLYWDNGAGKWQCQALSNYDLSDLGIKILNDLDDTDVGSPTNQYVLYWDGTASKWKAQALSNYDLTDLGTKEFDNLDDVNVSTPSDGCIVYWDNGAGKWQCQALSNWDLTDLGTKNLDDLDDVDASSPLNGYFISWNSTTLKWECRALIDSDIPDSICRDDELPEGIGIPDLEEKTSPIWEDLLLIIDSEESPVESKKAEIGNLPFASTTTAAVTLYVDAGSGDDGDSGTSTNPKETINGALDALPVTIAHPVTICVRGQQNYPEGNEAIEFGRFNTLETITIKAVNANDEDMYDNGQVTSSTSNTLTDSSKSWTTNQIQNAYVWVFHGTGEGEIQQISSNTGDTITISGTWSLGVGDYFAVGGGATMTGTGTYHFYNAGKLVDFYGLRHTGATTADIMVDRQAISSVGYNYFDTSVRGVFVTWSSILGGPDPQYNCSEATSRAFEIMGVCYASVRGNLIDGAAIGIRVYYVSMVAGSSTDYRQNHIQNCTIGISVESGSGMTYASAQSFGTGGDANGQDIDPATSTTIPRWWD